MSALAYLALPVSGAVAYLLGAEARTRFHGLQAIVIGLTWPVALYVASVLSARATQVVFVTGAAVWLMFLVVTAAGRDPRLPLVGSSL